MTHGFNLGEKRLKLVRKVISGIARLDIISGIYGQ